MQVSGHGKLCRGTATWGKGGGEQGVEAGWRRGGGKSGQRLYLRRLPRKATRRTPCPPRSISGRSAHMRATVISLTNLPQAPRGTASPPPCSTSNTPKPHLHAHNNRHVRPVHAPATPADVQAAPAVPGGLAGAGDDPGVRHSIFTMMQSTGPCSILSIG
jgi:hypothetical protein